MTRQSDPLFDDRVADWLEGDPDRAPDQALEIVLAAFPSIRQRRRGLGFGNWRIDSMTFPTKLALTAVTTIAIALGGFYLLDRRDSPRVGGPSPSPSPSPSPIRYTSDRFHYSIDVPASWTIVPATTDLPLLGFPFPDGTNVDRFEPVAGGKTWVFVTSGEFLAEETAEERRAGLDSLNTNTANCRISATRTITVAEAEARSQEMICFADDNIIEIFMARYGRMYMIDWFSDEPVDDADRTTFDAMVSTFRFEP